MGSGGTLNTSGIRLRCGLMSIAFPFSKGARVDVNSVEDEGRVDSGGPGSARLVRVGTQIAQNDEEIHMGLMFACGSGGKSGPLRSPRRSLFQLP